MNHLKRSLSERTNGIRKSPRLIVFFRTSRRKFASTRSSFASLGLGRMARLRAAP